MRVFHGLTDLPAFRNAVITIGTFDGVHIGHQAILEKLAQRAREVGGESVLITFDPHPRLVLSPQNVSVELLSSLAEKLEALSHVGIDNVVVVPFTAAFANMSASSYVRDFLITHFHPHTFIIGYDHRFGYKREGDFHLLEKLKTEYHFLLEEIPVQEIQDLAISSTRVREALHQGNISKANDYLGRPYTLRGQVVHGEQRGRRIGYPTANMECDDIHKLIPANGVYAIRAFVNAKTYIGMMNIGIRPTVSHANKRSVEAHLFDFHDDIYGETVRIEMIQRLRDEQKFDSIDALQAQLDQDKLQAQKVFL
jgi:riboflavin kinase/FMN adenylyltransferase